MATIAFCRSLGVGLPALIFAVESNFTHQMRIYEYMLAHSSAKPLHTHILTHIHTHTHTHTNTQTHTQLLLLQECTRGSSGDKCGLFVKYLEHDTGQKQPPNQSTG